MAERSGAALQKLIGRFDSGWNLKISVKYSIKEI